MCAFTSTELASVLATAGIKKITKGSQAKVVSLAHNYSNSGDEGRYMVLSLMAMSMSRFLDLKAANRPSIDKMVETATHSDSERSSMIMSNFPGMIGYSSNHVNV